MKNIFVFILSFAMFAAHAQKIVSYTDGNQKLEGLIYSPKKGVANGNAVLLLPAWMGIDNNAKENAKELENATF